MHIQVGYEAGSEGIKLPPIYMKSLDNELIQVLHKAAQSSQDAHTVLELIFYVLDDWRVVCMLYFLIGDALGWHWITLFSEKDVQLLNIII